MPVRAAEMTATVPVEIAISSHAGTIVSRTIRAGAGVIGFASIALALLLCPTTWIAPSPAFAAGALARYRVVSTAAIPMAPIGDIAVSKDGGQIAAAGLWGTVDIWDWRRGTIVRSRKIRDGYIENVFFMDDDRRLSVLYAEDIQQHLYVWELATGAVADEDMVESLGRAYPAPDGTIGIEHGNGMAFMDQRGAYANRYVVPRGMSIGYALSPDGKVFAGPGTGYHDGVRYYDHLVISDSEGKLLKLIDIGFDASDTVFSPDSRIVAVLQRDDRGKPTPEKYKTAVNGYDLYDLDTGKKRRRIGGHNGYVSGGVFSPDAARFLTWSKDRTLALWDVASGTLVRRFEGHRDSVTRGLFLDGGALIASSGMDGSVKIWSVADGREIVSFQAIANQTDEPSFVALQPDGRLFESGPKRMKIIEVKTNGADGPALADDKRAALRVPALEITAAAPSAATAPAKR
jgi:WD40 repeat protein